MTLTQDDTTTVTEKVVNYWEGIAKKYADSHDFNFDASGEIEARNMLGEIVKDMSSSLNVLDVGCGPGTISIRFAWMGHKVTGIDLSAKMLKAARLKSLELGLDVTFLEGDASKPQFEQETFDIISARQIIWMLTDPRRALSEWYKLLKPKGRVIILDSYMKYGKGKTFNIFKKDVRDQMPLANAVTGHGKNRDLIVELFDLLRRANFKKIAFIKTDKEERLHFSTPNSPDPDPNRRYFCVIANKSKEKNE